VEIVTEISRISIDEWQSFLLHSPKASPFQTIEFYDFINSVNGYSAKVFALSDNGRIAGIVLVALLKEPGMKGLFSRRGIIYGGPVISEESEGYFAFLLKEINRYFRNRVIYLETRNNFSFDNLKSVFRSHGWQYSEHLNVQLDLRNKSLEDILQLMTYNRRREVKMSLKAGVEVIESQNIDEVIKLYQILKDLYDSKVKLPLPSEEYFLKLSLSPVGKTFIVLHYNEVIGGSFCLLYKDIGIYTLYYAGIRDYNKKIFPTHMAIIGAIEYAIANKIKMIDFMGAGKPNVKYGVRDFKMQFGGSLVDHGRFIKIMKPLLFQIGKVGLRVYQLLKSSR
jgi:serine/alanine adding enzyme